MKAVILEVRCLAYKSPTSHPISLSTSLAFFFFFPFLTGFFSAGFVCLTLWGNCLIKSAFAWFDRWINMTRPVDFSLCLSTYSCVYLNRFGTSAKEDQEIKVHRSWILFSYGLYSTGFKSTEAPQNLCIFTKLTLIWFCYLSKWLKKRFKWWEQLVVIPPTSAAGSETHYMSCCWLLCHRRGYLRPHFCPALLLDTFVFFVCYYIFMVGKK